MLLLLLMNAGCCLNINNCRKKPPAQVISKRYCICTKRQYQYKLHIQDAVIKPMLKCILSTEYKVFFSRLMGNVYSLSFVGYLHCFFLLYCVWNIFFRVACCYSLLFVNIYVNISKNICYAFPKFT